MSAVLHVLFLLVVLAYVAAAVLSVRALDVARGSERALGVRMLAGAAALQLAALVVVGVWQGQEALQGAALALGVFAVVLAGGFAGFASRYRVEAAGVLVAPTALVAGVLSAATSHAVPVVSGQFLWAKPLHVVTVATASGAMALAAAMAFVYLTQDARLKRKDTSFSVRSLVPLAVLERTVAMLCYTAFGFYTVAVLAGAFMLRARGLVGADLLGRAAAGLVTWLLFGAVVGHRLLLRARGKRAMRGVVLAFGLAMALYAAYASFAAHAVAS